ncbi:MAG: bifunctional diguanylate cyclase/phosphodiesterase [Psychromonas sp.]
MNDQILYIWLAKHKKNLHLIMLPVLLFLIAAVGGLVYMTGGIKYVYSHTMYIPILLGGIVFGKNGGALIGLLAGFLLGPWMPIEVSRGESQELFNWVYRAGFFTLMGFLCGLVSDSVRSYIGHIKWLSRYDIFSSLPNRTALLEQIKEISAQQVDGSDAYMLAIISIENENELLSTFGIGVLDNAVVQMVNRLQKKEPHILSIFRISSARLGLLICRPSNQQGEGIFDKLSEIFQKSILFEGIYIHIDIRIGSVDLADNLTPPERYLQQAKRALATARDKDYDHVSFHPAIASESRDNIIMLGELTNALKQNQLLLHYQPKVDITTGEVIGVEALLRWPHPLKGNIPPGVFIPRAEESTLINQITYYVLNQAMAQMVLWQNAGINIPVAVNISARNLLQPNFSNDVFSLLEHHGLSGEQLELEITEGALMRDVQRALDELNKLAAAKISLSIDDFGTGYSSLQYLHQLPVSFLKIDRSFVCRLPADKSAISIVETAVSMAHKMNIQTIAEGIEDKETYDFLKNIGCDMAQGYMISRPLPAEEYTKWHTQHQGVFGKKV